SRAGFGVILPAELTAAGRQRLRTRMYVAVEQPVVGIGAGLNANTLATFSWQAALGDEVLSPEEFRAIVDAKRELVRWRDKWILVDERDIVEASAVAGRSGTMSLTQAAGAVLGAPVAGQPRADVVADAPLTSLLDRLTRATVPDEITEPDRLIG